MTQNTYIGTSGWNYPDWVGPFYPEKMKSYADLAWYSTQFNSTENNSSFYHIPRQSTFQKWAGATSDNFIFSLKLNKRFTHLSKLHLHEEDIFLLCDFLENLQLLKNKLGALLIQIPPGVRYDFSLVKNFISILSDKIKDFEFKPNCAIEFRHQSWFQTDVYSILEKYNIAVVHAQSSRYPSVKIQTADFSYTRFHGPEKMFDSSYTESDLHDWCAGIKNSHSKINYIYFNNTMHARAIPNARYMQKLFE